MGVEGAYRVYGQLEPTVINEELLTYACFAEGPKGEAGRLAEIEGIAFDSVKSLTLSYQSRSFCLHPHFSLKLTGPL